MSTQNPLDDVVDGAETALDEITNAVTTAEVAGEHVVKDALNEAKGAIEKALKVAKSHMGNL